MLKTIAVCLLLMFVAATPLRAASRHAAPQSGGGAGQFASEAAAKAHCPGDTIVWASLGKSKAYHLSGNRYYGKTKHGAYMCQKEADRSGFHLAGRRAGTAAKPGKAKTSK
jgi:hypothetical protein